METNQDVISTEDLSKEKLFKKFVIYFLFISWAIISTLLSLYLVEFLKDSFGDLLFEGHNINYMYIIFFYIVIISFTINISCDARNRLHKYGNNFEISIVMPAIRIISVIMILYFIYLCVANCLNLIPSSHPDFLYFGTT